MSVSFYMDVHIPRAITNGLRIRGVEVLTAQEDHRRELSDPELLDRATELGHVLFTQDDDLLREAAIRLRLGKAFARIIFAHQMKVTAGRCLRDIELIAKACDSADLVNRVFFLPLK